MKFGVGKAVATFFGLGYLPYLPGTWASLFGFGAYFLLRNNFITCLGLSIVVFLLGILVCGRAEKELAARDSRFIVIDEIAAMLILLTLVSKFISKEPLFLFFAFLSFRFFDIIKPYPIKKIENFSGSWGIMLDDVVAAFYAFISLWLIRFSLGGSCGK
jgi:phosphatidylglycerophosphatase A